MTLYRPVVPALKHILGKNMRRNVILYTVDINLQALLINVPHWFGDYIMYKVPTPTVPFPIQNHSFIGRGAVYTVRVARTMGMNDWLTIEIRRWKISFVFRSYRACQKRPRRKATISKTYLLEQLVDGMDQDVSIPPINPLPLETTPAIHSQPQFLYPRNRETCPLLSWFSNVLVRLE